MAGFCSSFNRFLSRKVVEVVSLYSLDMIHRLFV